MKTLMKDDSLFTSIAEIILTSRLAAYRNTNAILLKMNWEIGKIIIEDEQAGKAKAAYGKAVLKHLSIQLSIEFSKGFEERNLNNMRAFYLAFPIWNAVRTELSWTHYRIISRVENELLRIEYMIHAIDEN